MMTVIQTRGQVRKAQNADLKTGIFSSVFKAYFTLLNMLLTIFRLHLCECFLIYIYLKKFRILD